VLVDELVVGEAVGVVVVDVEAATLVVVVVDDVEGTGRLRVDDNEIPRREPDNTEAWVVTCLAESAKHDVASTATVIAVTTTTSLARRRPRRTICTVSARKGRDLEVSTNASGLAR
jgi:hypothetical protein